MENFCENTKCMEKNTDNPYKLLHILLEKAIVYKLKLCYNGKD